MKLKGKTYKEITKQEYSDIILKQNEEVKETAMFCDNENAEMTFFRRIK